MIEFERISPVVFKSRPVKTENRDNWEVVMEYSTEGDGPYLVDLSHKPRFDLIISLHCNVAVKKNKSEYLPILDEWGFYAIFDDESTKGRQLAQSLANSCGENGISLYQHGLLSTVQLGRRLAWIHKTNPVSVLTELGFMTNEQELQLLLTATYQQKLIRSLADGIDHYLTV